MCAIVFLQNVSCISIEIDLLLFAGFYYCPLLILILMEKMKLYYGHE